MKLILKLMSKLEQLNHGLTKEEQLQKKPSNQISGEHQRIMI